MADPTTTNSTATIVDAGINDVVQAAETAATTAAETALDTAAPFFALPVIKDVSDEVIKLIISMLGNQISIGLQNVGTFIVIDTQISKETSGISTALANLMLAEKSGNAAQIQAAIRAYANAQSALVHDDGSSTASA